MEISSQIAAYIATLPCTQGEGAGERFRLLPWQSDVISGAFAEGVETAAFSVARGNGKTTLMAAVATAAVDGPLRTSRAETVVVASSLAQARILFEHTLAMVPTKSGFHVQDNTSFASITSKFDGSRLRCIGSDPQRAHGMAPLLLILDEGAQWPAHIRDKMFAALQTSLGKIPGSRLIAIGTRPDDPRHWFSRLLDQENTSAHYSVSWSASKDVDVLDEDGWRAANPSYDHMPSLAKSIRTEAEAAAGDAGREMQFRALRLNSGTPDTDLRDVLIGVDVWRDLARPCEARGEYLLGLDLGGAAALSAAAGYWPATGLLRAAAAVGDNPGPEQRGRLDGVGDLYVRCLKARELLLTRGRVADLGLLLEHVRILWGPPAAVVCDRYRLAELKDVMDRAGLRWPVTTRLSGFREGGEDVRLFRDACLAGRLLREKNHLLDVSVGSAVVVSDTQGVARLAKKTEGGRRCRTRDDVAAAAILAVAEGGRRGVEAPGPGILVC